MKTNILSPQPNDTIHRIFIIQSWNGNLLGYFFAASYLLFKTCNRSWVYHQFLENKLVFERQYQKGIRSQGINRTFWQFHLQVIYFEKLFHNREGHISQGKTVSRVQAF